MRVSSFLLFFARSNRRYLAALCIASAPLIPHAAAQARGLHILYTFCLKGGACLDGKLPTGGLVADAAGNLYGMTGYGGGSGNCFDGCGTIFRVAPDGTETVLHAFAGGAHDGCWPDHRSRNALILDANGNLYGAAGCGPSTGGVVFRLAPDGTMTILHAFDSSNHGIGSGPTGTLVMDAAGNLFGVGHGDYWKCDGGCGFVFKIATDGTETDLYDFCALDKCADGEFPNPELVMDDVGNLYGTTWAGGTATNCYDTCGTVFELSQNSEEKVLWSFCSQSNCADGDTPAAGLIRDASGNLYGTTIYGGDRGCFAGGCGTIFRVTSNSSETVLHAFHSEDGGSVLPKSKLLADDSGDLYGTSYEGAAYRLGTDGALTVVQQFNQSMGLELSSLIKDRRGNLYGASPYAQGPAISDFSDGAGDGAVFRIKN